MMNCAWHNSKCQLNCRICHINLKNQVKFKVHIAKHTKQSKNLKKYVNDNYSLIFTNYQRINNRI